MPRTAENKENLDRSVYLSYWNALDPSEYSFLSFILYKLEYGRCIKLTKKSLQISTTRIWRKFIEKERK